MFIYKFCPKCQKRNHKKHANCVRCGDQLLNNPKFGINVFVVTLSVIILLSSATVFASKSYFKQKTDNNNPTTAQEQNAESAKEEVTPAINQEPAKEETKVDTTTKATTTTPASTPPSQSQQTTTTTQPTCNESKKIALTNKYNSDISEAAQKRDGIINDANAEYAGARAVAEEKYKDIWDPTTREQLINSYIENASRALETKRSDANRDYNDTTTYLTMMYNLDMQSAHCSN